MKSFFSSNKFLALLVAAVMAISALVVVVLYKAPEQMRILKNRAGIVITNERVAYTFQFPDNYRVDDDKPDRLRIHFSYPNFTPKSPYVAHDDDSIFVDMWVNPNSLRAKHNYYLKSAGREFDPKKPGLHFYFGKQGIYEVYKYRSTPVDNTTYFFEAADGNLVRVDDNASFAFNHRYTRQIDDLLVTYRVSNRIKGDFKEIDSEVVAYLKSHIKKIEAVPAKPTVVENKKIAAPLY